MNGFALTSVIQTVGGTEKMQIGATLPRRRNGDLYSLAK